MFYKVEVGNKPGIRDAFGEWLKKDIEDLGLKGIESVEIIQTYMLEGTLKEADVEKICKLLLSEPITQHFSFRGPLVKEEKGVRIVEVAYNPGVMDPVEESVKKGIRDLGIRGIDSVKTSKKYILKGRITQKDLTTICEKLLVNRTVQHIVRKGEKISLPPVDYKFGLVTLNLLKADNKRLREISEKGGLSLNLEEMKAIKDYFKNLGRNPTDIELETIAQTWSEHCGHKTFRGLIQFQGQLIDNLLKSTIMKVTEELDKPWCISVFEDNSGVIAFDQDYNLCFKVETHNHPSALEPYGGAGTGIGGVIRDPLGTGLGAKPILCTDIFCFGPPDYPYAKLPRGVLHPRRILKGVVAGVRDYGNRMGIPTANGAILFDECFVCNPLVFCGNIGIIPKDKCKKRVEPGDLIVLIGGRTGRDGIHGVTFSSEELTEKSEAISSGAVQIGNPIVEKKMVDVLLQARDKGLYKAITDCGGGGLSSAVGEMGKEIGARVDLERVPLKYEGLTYTEIWISESQERMVLAVPQSRLNELIEIAAEEGVEVTLIGEFTNTHRLQLHYQGKEVASLDMDFLHKGIPRLKRKATWKKKTFREPIFEDPKDLTPSLLKILSSWNVCSKEWVIRQYDHEVQGGSVLKPLVGIECDGPSDACVIRPRFDSYRGIVVSNGLNPRYGMIDPYWMAASAIDEALRQIVSVGGDLEQVALLDNFCGGNPANPEKLGGLVRAAQACYDFAKIYGTPFISGKDSLNNEYRIKRKIVSIPPVLLISALGVIPDVRKIVSMDAKEVGDFIYVVGLTRKEMGGSEYYALKGFLGNQVPRVDARNGKKLMVALHKAIIQGLVRACHDCSEGGIGVAIAEMAFAGNLGMRIHLSRVPRSKGVKRNDTLLFSESNTRFIVEVPRIFASQFEMVLKGFAFGLLGEIIRGEDFKVFGLNGELIISAKLQDLKAAWQKPLRW